MKITDNKTLNSTLPANAARNRNAPSAGNAGAPAGAQVRISSLSSTLGRAEAAMANAPDIDHQRVNELKQAISEGRFTVDSSRIADALIDNVREMLGS